MNLRSTRQLPVKGSFRGRQKSPRVAVSFEPALFERIAGEAARRRVPFARVVRERMAEVYRETNARPGE